MRKGTQVSAWMSKSMRSERSLFEVDVTLRTTWSVRHEATDELRYIDCWMDDARYHLQTYDKS